MDDLVHDFDCEGATWLGRVLGKHTAVGLKDGAVLILRNVPEQTFTWAKSPLMVKGGVRVLIPYLEQDPAVSHAAYMPPPFTERFERDVVERKRLCIPDLGVDILCGCGPITGQWAVWRMPA